MENMPNGVLEWVVFIAREYSDLFVTGTLITLAVAVIGTLIGFILGFIMGIVDDTKIDADNSIVWKMFMGILKGICKVYIEVFRDTPMIVQAMIVYFGIRQCGFNIDPIAAGILVTTLNTGSYMAETVRGGIKSIDVGRILRTFKIKKNVEVTDNGKDNF